MNILIISQYYYPENFLINDIAQQMILDGHSVTVITGLPDQDGGEVPEEYLAPERWDEYVEGVHVLRCRTHPRKNGVINRARNYVSFVFGSLKKTKTLGVNYDVIFCYQLSPVSLVQAGITYGKKHNIPVIVYCLDLWPESLKAWGLRETNPLFMLIKRYARRLYSRADQLVVSSLPFKDYMKKVHSLDPDTVIYLPQHATDYYANIYTDWYENEVVDFVFAGNIGAVQIVDQILEAVKILARDSSLPPWKVHIIGDGSKYDDLIRKVEDDGLEDYIELYGRVSPETLTSHYMKADVFLLTLKADNHIGDTLPAKLQSYMSAGRPIAAMAGGSVPGVLNQAGCGHCVDPGDSKGYAQIMRSYCLSSETVRADGFNSRRYYEENFTFDKFMSSLYSIIDQTIEAS